MFPSHLRSASSKARSRSGRAASRLTGAASSSGKASRTASETTSFWIAAKLSKLCLGVAASSALIRSKRYGTVHSLVMKYG
ncbi:hypothetical protein D3C86_2014870 [compost metagenome]